MSRGEWCLVLVLLTSARADETVDPREETACAADTPRRGTSVLQHQGIITQRYIDDVGGETRIGVSRVGDVLRWQPPLDPALLGLRRSGLPTTAPKTKAPAAPKTRAHAAPKKKIPPSQVPSSTATPPSISTSAAPVGPPALEKQECKPICTAYRAKCVNGTCLCTLPFADSSCGLMVDKQSDLLFGISASIERILIVGVILASPLLLVPLVVSILPLCLMCASYFRLKPDPSEQVGPVDPSELHESWRYEELEEDDTFLFGIQESPRSRADEVARLRLALIEANKKAKSRRRELWVCSKCGETNDTDLFYCDSCNQPQPGYQVDPESERSSAPRRPSERVGVAGALAVLGAGVQGVADNIAAGSGRLASTVGDQAKKGAQKFGQNSWRGLKKVTGPVRHAIKDANHQFNVFAAEGVDPHRQTFKPISVNR